MDLEPLTRATHLQTQKVNTYTNLVYKLFIHLLTTYLLWRLCFIWKGPIRLLTQTLILSLTELRSGNM